MAHLSGTSAAFYSAKTPDRYSLDDLLSIVDKATVGCDAPDASLNAQLAARLADITDPRVLSEVVRRMRKKLKEKRHSTVMNALLLMEHLMDHLHTDFVLAMANLKLIKQMTKTVKQGSKSTLKARKIEAKKAIYLIATWARRYSGSPAIGKVFVEGAENLKEKGYRIPKETKEEKPVVSARPSLACSSNERRDVVKNITDLLNNMVTEASSDAELAANEVATQLYEHCRSLQTEVMMLIENAPEHELGTLVELSELLLTSVKRYEEGPDEDDDKEWGGAPETPGDGQTSPGSVVGPRPSFDHDDFFTDVKSAAAAAYDSDGDDADDSDDDADLVRPGEENSATSPGGLLSPTSPAGVLQTAPLSSVPARQQFTPSTFYHPPQHRSVEDQQRQQLYQQQLEQQQQRPIPKPVQVHEPGYCAPGWGARAQAQSEQQTAQPANFQHYHQQHQHQLAQHQHQQPMLDQVQAQLHTMSVSNDSSAAHQHHPHAHIPLPPQHHQQYHHQHQSHAQAPPPAPNGHQQYGHYPAPQPGHPQQVPYHSYPAQAQQQAPPQGSWGHQAQHQQQAQPPHQHQAPGAAQGAAAPNPFDGITM